MTEMPGEIRSMSLGTLVLPRVIFRNLCVGRPILECHFNSNNANIAVFDKSCARSRADASLVGTADAGTLYLVN